MTAAKHTPGPWEWDGNPFQYDKEQEAPWLMTAPWQDGTPVLSGEIRCNSEADASLIAAAPDLLAALIDCVAVMSRELDGLKSIQAELRYAQEAIAKATGEKQ